MRATINNAAADGGVKYVERPPARRCTLGGGAPTPRRRHIASRNQINLGHTYIHSQNRQSAPRNQLAVCRLSYGWLNPLRRELERQLSFGLISNGGIFSLIMLLKFDSANEPIIPTHLTLFVLVQCATIALTPKSARVARRAAQFLFSSLLACVISMANYARRRSRQVRRESQVQPVRTAAHSAS